MTEVQSPTIIVGAGPAGLACGERLFASGREFLILEARDRVGGRMWTNYDVLPGTPVEMGALMVHGRHVPTHQWIRDSGLHSRKYPTTWRARFVYHGKYSSTLGFAFPRPGAFGLAALVEGLRTIPREIGTYDGPELSLAEFLDRRNPRPGARLMMELLHAHTWSADPDQIGILAARNDDAGAHEPYGFRNFQVVEGYSELARRRAARLGSRIRLRTQVTHIRHEGPSILVDTLGPEGPISTYRCDRLVITVPLGVLKAGAIVFDPPLPEGKRRAIAAIGFGDVVTTALRFPDRSLAQQLGGFVLIWSGSASTFLRPSFASTGPKDVLLSFAVGREAARRAKLSDREIADVTVEELEAALPNGVRTPQVESVAISRWTLDPFLRGAYSYPALGSGAADRRTLAAPLDGRIFFAGEATHYGGEQATVHGAIETGWRAAEELLASLARPAPR